MNIFIQFQFPEEILEKTLPIDIRNIVSHMNLDNVISVVIDQNPLVTEVRRVSVGTSSNQEGTQIQNEFLSLDFSDNDPIPPALVSFFEGKLGITTNDTVYIDLSSCTYKLKAALILLKSEHFPNLVLLQRTQLYYGNILNNLPAFEETFIKTETGTISVRCKETVSYLLNETLERSNLFELKQSENELDALCPKIKGESESIRNLKERIVRLGKNFPILLTGERGTGKDLVAKTIYDIHESGLEYIPINCSGMTSELLPSELFGHKKGSFTGAYKDKEGILTNSANKIVFLDEITDIPLGVQRTLNRFLENGEYRRVGETNPRILDDIPRIIAATNEDIYNNDIFRQDLRSRFGTPFKIPPIRARMDDIPILISHFLSIQSEIHRSPFVIDEILMNELKNYTWPDNVRQIKNWVQEACIATYSDMITEDILNFVPFDSIPENVTQPIRLPDFPFNITEHLAHIKETAIETALQKSGGNRVKASRLLKQSDNYISSWQNKK